MKNKKLNLSTISLLTVFAIISACQPQNNITKPEVINTEKLINRTLIKGRAEFPALTNSTLNLSDKATDQLREKREFGTKATLSEVSSRSTVSIIYLPNHPTLANQTVATGLTDNTGNFSINPGVSFTPALNDAFILEAEKRIGGAGQEKLAIRTYIRWNGTGWDSMTSPGIIINSKTTALAIIAGLNTGTITVTDTINKIVSGVPQNINATVTAQKVIDVAALVVTVLTNNNDPVHYIGLQTGNYLVVNPLPFPTPTPTPTPSPSPTPVPIGEFRINTTTANYQITPTIAMDNSGNFVITWASQIQDGSATGLYAQKLNSAGVAVGSEFKVNTYTTDNQYNPIAAMDSNGNFVITWISSGQDGNLYGTYAQRFNSSGVAQGAEFKVNTYTTNDQKFSDVAMDSDGDFVVTWESVGQDGSLYGIYAKRYNSSGAVQGAEFKVNTYTTGNQSKPSIAMDSAGDFVITWYSNLQDGNGTGIYAQRYNAAGVVQGAEFKVNTYTTGAQASPNIAMDNSGNFIISWDSYGQDGSGNGVYAQRYNAAGVPQGAEFKVNAYTTADQRFACADMDSSGNFIITWSSENQDGNLYGIYGQRYNSTGVVQGSEFKVNAYTTGHQRTSMVAMDIDGDFVITWYSDNQDGSSYGVYAKRYNSEGTPQ
jgi:hypothetical protein